MNKTLQVFTRHEDGHLLITSLDDIFGNLRWHSDIQFTDYFFA